MRARNIDHCRCLLVTPATKPERFHHAVEVRADGIVIDLEDGVAPQEKDAARSELMRFLAGKGGVAPDSPFVTAIRVNNIHTLAGVKDLAAISEAQVHPDAILLPKVESPAEVEITADVLGGAQADITFVALIETGKGLQAADDIAASSQRLKAIAFGGGDLAADLGAVLSWQPMLFARSRVVQAAAAAGIVALDGPYLDLQDIAGLREECELSRNLGYIGKFTIHPTHVATVVTAFTPEAAALERARRIVQGFEEAHWAVCKVDGKMVDVPVYRVAMRTIALAGSSD